MAESVDALVSNTSGAIHPGSIPGLGTTSGCKCLVFTAAFLLLGSQKQQHSHITNDIYNIYTTKKSHKHFFYCSPRRSFLFCGSSAVLCLYL